MSRVIFLHIPKAAGNTIRSVALRNYPIRSVLAMPHKVHPGIAAFNNTPPEKLAAVQFMYGHVAFGIHERFPDKSKYMTFLRDPVERVLSFWRFIRGNPNHRLYMVANKFNTLREFLEAEITPEISNLQTVAISGKALASADCSELDYQLATSNLQSSFSVIGIVEEFDRSLALCSATFGWKDPIWNQLNRSAFHLERSDVDPADLALIQSLNEYDIRLYELGMSLFKTQCANHAPAIQRILSRPGVGLKMSLIKNALRISDSARRRVVEYNSRKTLGL
jgi:hypothetical protein